MKAANEPKKKVCNNPAPTTPLPTYLHHADRHSMSLTRWTARLKPSYPKVVDIPYLDGKSTPRPLSPPRVPIRYLQRPFLENPRLGFPHPTENGTRPRSTIHFSMQSPSSKSGCHGNINRTSNSQPYLRSLNKENPKCSSEFSMSSFLSGEAVAGWKSFRTARC